MSKRMDWDRARRDQRAAQSQKKPVTRQTTGNAMWGEREIDYSDPTLIWITVGADCPWNTTPGVRQVHCFKTIAEAKAAGFTGIK